MCALPAWSLLVPASHSPWRPFARSAAGVKSVPVTNRAAPLAGRAVATGAIRSADGHEVRLEFP